MKIIKKMILKNFKKFRSLEVCFDKRMNVFIGDNETGKSTILSALDFVLSGSKSKVEKIGVESLFNVDVIKEFLGGDRKIENLPEIIIDVYLSEQNNPDLNGKNNISQEVSDGLRLHCLPLTDFHPQIRSALSSGDDNFPFEYYAIKFLTFSAEPYGGFRKYLKHLMIDSSQVNNEYATREYVRDIYALTAKNEEKYKLKNEYRQSRRDFVAKSLEALNSRLDKQKLGLRYGDRHGVEADLIITENEIPIESMGKGRQSFIKTEFALNKKNESEIDVILLEEPENHLSYINMKKLINRISITDKQLFVATHSSLIVSRLGLNFVQVMPESGNPVRLQSLTKDTYEFFIKVPDSNILEFLLAPKLILVEGSAEYILMGAMYKRITGSEIDDSGVHVISVNGLSFKRYLEIGKLLGKKIAVIRDNDGNYDENCVQNYADYSSNSIKIFSDTDNNKMTFEICFYQSNSSLCDEVFKSGRRKLTVQSHMLSNKADAALEILLKKGNEIQTPVYIKEAIEWIKN